MWQDYEITDVDLTLDVNLFNTSTWENIGLLDSLHTWNDKPMDQWDASEVIEFIFSEISHRTSDSNGKVDLYRFQCISGYIFRSLTEQNCKILSNSDEIGGIIYEAKERYSRLLQQKENELGDNPNVDDSQNIDPTTPTSVSSFSSSDTDSDMYSVADRVDEERKPGRPRTREFCPRLEKRSPKLYEFLIQLLGNADTCPKLIRWENIEEGTFRFVQSDKVAKLWGSRKQNANMNYEKFSRAMRYYYKSQVLLPVPGKRLVYKFGPHAKGWRPTQ